MPNPKVLILLGCLALAPALFGDVVNSLPFVPPSNGIYTIPDTCVSPVCLTDIQLGDFHNTSGQLMGGNELESSDVTLTANAFRDVSNAPGPPIGSVTLTGSVDITYFNKVAFSQLGTFNATITSLDLSGQFKGPTGTHTIEAQLNPNQATTGQTTVTNDGGHPATFGFQSFFDVFAELKIDTGPFMPGPERTATLTSTPEPGLLWIVGGALAAMAAGRGARRKRAAA